MGLTPECLYFDVETNMFSHHDSERYLVRHETTLRRPSEDPVACLTLAAKR